MHHTTAQVGTCVVVLVLLALDLCMALASYRQFGWRVYSRIACDMRAKDGKSKQKTFLLIHIFLTMLKLDAQVSSSESSVLCCDFCILEVMNKQCHAMVELLSIPVMELLTVDHCFVACTHFGQSATV